MSDWTLRARQAMTEYVGVVVAVLVVLALLGGWLTYTGYAAPGTETEQRVVSSWEERGAYSHAATVTEPNPLYDQGTVLEDRSVYFTSIAPRLNGTFTYGYTASGDGELSVTVEPLLVVRSVEEEQGGNGTVFWERTDPLGDATSQRLAPGERVRVPFELNVSAVANRTERIEQHLGGSVGTTEALVRARVTASGTVNGAPVEESRAYDLPVELGTAYRVESVENPVETHERRETTTAPADPGALRTVFGPMIALGALLLLGAVVVGTTRGDVRLDDEERERLRYTGDRSEFDDWITRFRLPTSVHERERAEAESLSDLVDLAIDTDNGVVEDPADGAYYVVTPDLLYVYTPPEDAERPAGASEDSTGADDDPGADDDRTE
jgi:hypothetical protein